MIIFSKDLINGIRNSCKRMYPFEFLGLFRKSQSGIVDQIILPPNSLFGRGFTTINFWSLPAQEKYVGSVHSHPGRNNSPSIADLDVFSRTGDIHMIIGYPYGNDDVAVYDGRGRPLKFEIL